MENQWLISDQKKNEEKEKKVESLQRELAILKSQLKEEKNKVIQH